MIYEVFRKSFQNEEEKWEVRLQNVMSWFRVREKTN